MKLVLLIVAILVVLVLFGGSFVAMCFACLHARWLTNNADRAIQHSSLRRYAKELSAGFQWIAAQPSETVTIKAYDGVRLVARYLPCDNARGTLLLFHGWRSYPELDFGVAMEFYRSQGLNLLFVDERAQGESEGKFITFGVRERHDVATWAAYAAMHFGPAHPLILDGLSMGAATVLMASDLPLPLSVRGIIADCGFSSPYAIMKSVFRAHCRRLPAGPFLALTDVFTRLFAGFSLKGASTLDAVAKTKLPILFIHGTGDTFVPCSMTQAAYDACAAPKQLVLVPDAGHGCSYLVDRPRVQAELAAFLSKHVSKEEPI